jgi:hypothetical protein
LQAFSSCKAGDFDLSFECLTSQPVLQCLCDVEKDDPELRSKISPCTSTQQNDGDTNDEPAFDDDTNKDGNDISVPVEVITQVDFDCEHIPDRYWMDESGSLAFQNESEVFEREEDVDGGDDMPIIDVEEVGRGKRRQTANKQYMEFWKH